MAENNINVSYATKVQDPTSQFFRTKISDKLQDNEIHNLPNVSKNGSCILQHESSHEKTVCRTQTLVPITDPTACYVNVSNETQIENTELRNGEHVKKKYSQNQLKPISNDNTNTTVPIKFASPSYLAQNINSIQEFFLKQVSPMYAAVSTKHLENQHHPHFQLTHNIIHSVNEGVQSNSRQHATSVPSTPVTLPPKTPSSVSTPSSPVVQSELTTIRFLENALQHPLLCKTFHKRSDNFQYLPGSRLMQKSLSQVNNECVNKINVGKQNKSPRKKKNKKKDNENCDKSFDPYMCLEDVEAGLINNLLLEGVLRINPKQFQHSYVSGTDRSEQDILIDGVKNRNRALEGDVVIVQLIDSDEEDSSEENKQKKGKVVYIKEKVHNRTSIGTLKLMSDKNTMKALFVPRDYRVPRLNVPFTCWPDNFYQNSALYKDTLFLAEILDWSDPRFALGKIVCNIGQSGDMASETRAILAQSGLHVKPYGPEVRHLFPRLDFKIPDEEILAREDCRQLCVFSIDPFNSRDIDDAVSCKELPNGNYEIGVHIADVAYFLPENTLLDQKVADRATTIYLVEKAYHMLPDELCMLCSLCPGVDKLAFSVFWEVTEDGIILKHRFTKTVMNSCCQLTYEHAQAVLEDDTNVKFPKLFNNFAYEDVYRAIKVIGKIAAILRKNRFDNGALRIDQPKVYFNLNPLSGLPDSCCIYENKESHQMIEEFMLLANMTVARKIRDDHPSLAFLRCHPPPSTYMLRQLAKSLKPMGIELNISSAGDLHRSLLPHTGSITTDKAKVMVLNMLCAKPMTRAKYFCADGLHEEDFYHYALNVPLYTHFTSPIRRYADIMVHRLLAASLKYTEVPKWKVDKVRMVAANCNKQKYNAKKAGELSTELYILKYIEMHSPVVTDAAVVEVKDKYIDVIIITMGLNRRIFFNDFPGTYRCIKNDKSARLSKMELTWEGVNGLSEQKQIIEVFSILRVELSSNDEMVKIETKIVKP